MTRLFADNIGIVNIIEKQIAFPANIEITMKVESDSGYEKLKKPGFSCFITGFQDNKKSQYQVKRSLDQKTHIIPFGEAPEILTIQGVTFGFSQINAEGVGGVGELGGEGIKGYRVDLPDGKELLDREPAGSGEGEDGDGAGEGKDEPSEGFVGKIGGWVTSVQGVATGLRDSLRDKFGSGLTTLGEFVDNGLNVIQEVGNLVNSVLALPGQIVGALVGGLLGTEGPQPQDSPRAGANAEFFPLSFTELHMLFENLHAGSTSRVSNKAYLTISYCGVRYKCVVDSVQFSANNKSHSIEFSMNLLCVSTVTYLNSVTGSVVRTKAEAPTLFAQVGQALGGAAMAQIRKSNPTVGSVSIGRLLG